MNGTQILAGYKTYGVALLAVAYAAYGFFYAHTLDQQTALGVVAAALGLSGLRSGLTTEMQKLLASFGVSPSASGSVETAAFLALNKIQSAVRSAGPAAGKVAVALLMLLLVSPMLTGCQTYDALFGNGAQTTLCSTPSQCVYQAKGVFAGGVAVVTTYGSLPACPEGTPICKNESLLASIRTQAHTVQSELDAADLLVNSGLLPSGQPATPADEKTAAENAAKAATDFKTAAIALPHS